MSPPILKSSVPIPIDDKILIDVISKAKDFAIMHGSAMRSKSEYSPDSLQVNLELFFFSFFFDFQAPIYISVCSVHFNTKFIPKKGI